jgi:hypothetical protein
MATEFSYTIAPLSPETWSAFDALVQRHNGIFGGCWCIWFHPDGPERGQGAEANRALKKAYVEQGKADAALVMDGDEAIAWAEYGTPVELPTSTTARSTRPPAPRIPTTGSPASSSTSATGDGPDGAGYHRCARPDCAGRRRAGRELSP